VTTTVQPGHLFMPMHYQETNLLTCPAFDPYSRQPAYKHCAVRVERIGREIAQRGRAATK
jgi:assimilatory nitrate reductase catalytic subunit